MAVDIHASLFDAEDFYYYSLAALAVEFCAGEALPRANGAASWDLLNPLASPIWRLKGICEILRFVHYLAVAEFHDAHRVCWPALVGDCVFRDPEITCAENSPDIEA